MKQTFDVIVIGAGNAGLAASAIAKKAGLSVAIIEKDGIGGTCPLRGCVPKKVLVAAAEVIDKINHASSHHIHVGKPSIDWPQLIKRKREIISPLSSSFEKSLHHKGIELIRGSAEFVDDHTVVINNSLYEAKKIVIATGSTPHSLPIEGFHHVITSDDILELEELPPSLLFIGAGVVSLEFSHVFARAGVKVTLLEAASRPLPQWEEEIVEKLVLESEKLGITIITSVEIKSIKKNDSGFAVHFLQNRQEKSIRAEFVANGAGRVPNVDKLNLEAAHIEHEGHRIILDEYLRSRSNSDIFVAGDPTSSAQLSPVATYEGKVVGHNLTNDKMISPDYSSIPSCVFTVPALASVGLTETQAREKNLEFISKTNDLTSWLSGRTYAESTAFSKILIEKGTNQILGAHIIGHDGPELINLLALAMKHGVSSTQIKEMVFAYPTFGSDLSYMV
ncbi:MAG: NAD(P)/FAD-dependent oxidoreductase [Alphaproteobacteria bacterium]|nr:NAD(P)/FAD-dependent oxidoreductase [Alphaproteobacteria bacterium]